MSQPVKTAVQPIRKSYKNLEFLSSSEARTIRILCEYHEPQARFEREGVDDTLIFFGSARILAPEVAHRSLEVARHDQATGIGSEGAVRAAELKVALSRYYEEARVLSHRLTEWSISREGTDRRYLVCTGGGPGIMEAANRGASEVPGGRTVGLGISLPFEEQHNTYITPELAFEFHYFFMRKYWFAYMAKGMVVFPGGFGTLDEFAELMTLRQTGKMRKPLPIVLFGRPYWDEVLDIEAMARWGTISPEDVDLVFRTDDVDEAYEFLVRELSRHEGAR